MDKDKKMNAYKKIIVSALTDVNHSGGFSVSAASLLPSSNSYYHYGGSLTIAFCSEDMN
jgi:carbonic anhydrase